MLLWSTSPDTVLSGTKTTFPWHACTTYILGESNSAIWLFLGTLIPGMAIFSHLKIYFYIVSEKTLKEIACLFLCVPELLECMLYMPYVFLLY